MMRSLRLGAMGLLATLAVTGTTVLAQAAPATETAAPTATAPAATPVAPPPVVVPNPPPTAPIAATATGTPVAATQGTAPAPGPAYEPLKPTPGIGMPVDRGMGFQQQFTQVGERARMLNDAILLPIMFAITLLVLGLLLWVVARYRRSANPVPSKTSHNTVIEVIWTLVPVLILVGISLPSIGLLAEQYRPAKADALTIKVTGYQWNWGYAYPDHGIDEYISKMLDEQTAKARGEPYQLAVDNRMVVPVGQQVKLLITGGDVIHSWAVPSLWTKMDAVPGRSNETTFTIEKPGVYYGQCSELCGIDHAFMPIAVEAVPPAQFAAWVASKGGTMPGAAALAGDAPLPAAGAVPNAAVAGAAPISANATSAAAGETTAQAKATTARDGAGSVAPRTAPQGDQVTAGDRVAGPEVK